MRSSLSAVSSFAFLLLPFLDGDGNVAVGGGLVAVEVCGEDAQGVVAGGKLGRVPESALGATVAHGVGHFVEEARLFAPVDGDAACVGVGDLGRFGVGRQSVELNRDARAFEAGCRCAVGQKELVARAVEAEASARLVAVHLVVCVNYYPHTAAQRETPAALLRQTLARFAEQLYAVALDLRRGVVCEARERERERVRLSAGRAEVHVDVVHAVDGAERVADAKARAATHAHARECAVVAADGVEEGAVEHAVVFVATDAQVYVCDESGAQTFVERAEAPVGERAGNFLFAHGADDLAVGAEHVEAGV